MDNMMVEKERVFDAYDKDGKTIQLKIVEPTQTILEEADLKYRQKFSEALRNKLMTRAQCELYVRKHNIVDNEVIIRKDEIEQRIIELRGKLEECSQMEGFIYLSEINNLKAEAQTIHSLTYDIYKHSAEGYAEDFKLQWLGFKLVKNLDGSDYFATFKDFADQINSATMVIIFAHLMRYLYGVSDDYEEKLPENMWAKNNLDAINEVIEKTKAEIAKHEAEAGGQGERPAKKPRAKKKSSKKGE